MAYQVEPETAKAPPLAAHSIADDTSAVVLLKNLRDTGLVCEKLDSIFCVFLSG
jgi:hypothetical protein